ncbi:hypothetical protein NDU88_001182 [Pleurodeles waltl]|uniref:Uncharacterized protein n=1 Tax=Pleurodeles waltl TaxID=8319 RepID=A0AAV7LF65_PLEWA|nr:hypothetical protein NDU88_001182 [Pleurodeles waltl]
MGWLGEQSWGSTRTTEDKFEGIGQHTYDGRSLYATLTVSSSHVSLTLRVFFRVFTRLPRRIPLGSLVSCDLMDE